MVVEHGVECFVPHPCLGWAAFKLNRIVIPFLVLDLELSSVRLPLSGYALAVCVVCNSFDVYCRHFERLTCILRRETVFLCPTACLDDLQLRPPCAAFSFKVASSDNQLRLRPWPGPFHPGYRAIKDGRAPACTILTESLIQVESFPSHCLARKACRSLWLSPLTISPKWLTPPPSPSMNRPSSAPKSPSVRPQATNTPTP